MKPIVPPVYTRNEIIAISQSLSDQELFDEAATLTKEFASKTFDMCSIVNAKSGRCSENCKWCAQSAHFATACETYDAVDVETILKHAYENESQGIKRLSIVMSGRTASDTTIAHVCECVRAIRAKTSLQVCASMGLLNQAQLQRLFEAGVSRYHCNLESSPDYFPTLCSTHTQAEKLATLQAALNVGMSICSGGIIGMGESEIQRIDLAFALQQLPIQSIPINILSPIPGTPLADTPLLSERDIARAVALFRLVHPTAFLRLAGGRARLSDATLDLLLKIGINSAIEGNLLTTLGHTVAEDLVHIHGAGYVL